MFFDELPNGVLLVENNGWEGSRPEVASKLSRESVLVSVYWSVSSDMSFDEHTNDLEFGVERALEDSFRLAELVTGIEVQREWFDVPHRCVDVAPLAEQR